MRIRRAEFDADCADLLRQDGDLHSSDPIPWEHHATWVARNAEGELVGIAACREDRSDPTGIFLSTCFVAPAARGHGLQKRLIRARIRWARKQGYLWVWSYTAAFSVASMRSLIACGLRPSRRRAVPGYVCWELPLCSKT